MEGTKYCICKKGCEMYLTCNSPSFLARFGYECRIITKEEFDMLDELSVEDSYPLDTRS